MTFFKSDVYKRIFLAFLFLSSVTWSDVNVALQKPAIQSSTRTSPKTILEARNAVDGNLEADLNEGSCAQTSPKEDTVAQWWMVDLLQKYIISSVHILYRQDKFTDHFGNFMIETFLSNPTVFPNAVATLCHHYTGSNFPGNGTLFCTKPVLGRFLMIRKILPSPYKALALCEVIVFSNLGADLPTLSRNTALKMVPQTHLEATDFATYENKTELQCCLECVREERCQGVNHNHLTSTCVLVLDTWDTDQSQSDNSWTLYHIC